MAIHVLTSDPRLREGLSRQLANSGRTEVREFESTEPAARTDVVVAPVSSCSLEQCRALSGKGFRVIVLAPVERPAEAEAYRKAGAAAYLPMTLDISDLIHSVLALASDGERSADESTPNSA